MIRTNKVDKPFAVMAWDPSVTGWGWVVLNGKGVIIDQGCIKTEPSPKKLRIRKGDDRTRRITEINTILLSKIKEHGVTYIVSELPHGSQSAVAATMLGVVIGLGQTITDVLDISVDWYSEGDSKKNALGKRSAVKQEMIDKMDELYEVEWTGIKYKDEAVADALAIHHIARQQSPILKMFK